MGLRFSIDPPSKHIPEPDLCGTFNRLGVYNGCLICASGLMIVGCGYGGNLGLLYG